MAESDVQELLHGFAFERVLDEVPNTRTMSLLGTITHSTRFPAATPAIVIASKTHFDTSQESLSGFGQEFGRVKVGLVNDVYHSLMGWKCKESGSSVESEADAKMTIIVPATDVHIRKYSAQTYKMVRETPQLYNSVTLPYIQSFPPSRTKWVYNILDHLSESERIVYEDTSPDSGFLLLPDLKWDGKTLSSLYFLCLVHPRDIKSLRDLRPKHLPMLHNIRKSAYHVVQEKYNVEKGELRMFIHYQPSYYHFHVHITHIRHEGFSGMTVGQAHLLEDIIDVLEIEQSTGSPGDVLMKRTLTFGLGEQHGLFPGLWTNQVVE